MISPAQGRVTSEYGKRRPIPGVTTGSFHAGIDIANATGTPIHAAYAGTVVAAGNAIVQGRSGNGILIRNADGEQQYYGHLARIRVSVGDRVAAGQRIGDMGATGNVTGPHLHFETWNRDRSTRNPRTDFAKAGVAPGSKPQTGPEPKAKPKPKPKLELAPASVVTIKKALTTMGVFTGVVSSADTRAFRAAITTYQRRQVLPDGGLLADGEWGSITQAHFAWVLRLQGELNRWKGSAIAVDGDYFTRTRERVAHTQQRNGLKPDGLAGPITCRLLGIPAHPSEGSTARLAGSDEIGRRAAAPGETARPAEAPAWSPLPDPPDKSAARLPALPPKVPALPENVPARPQQAPALPPEVSIPPPADVACLDEPGPQSPVDAVERDPESSFD